jgi:3-deoxy-D-manno-octulosonic-acid transferase
MGILLDLIYVLAAAISAPLWMRKSRSGWGERFGRAGQLPAKSAPRVLIHAVSVGEVNLISPLVDKLLVRGNEVVVSVTTDTGTARAHALYDGRCPIVRYPLDATFMVRRFLNATNPDAVVLTELEVWPNFVSACAKRGISVGVVNGRLSTRSFKNYRKARFALRKTFARLAFVCAQDNTYAQRFVEMGVPAAAVQTTGTMKWDSAQSGTDHQAAEALRSQMGIDPDRPLVVAGSTAPEEHALLDAAVGEQAQLLCAPRRPEWFDDAAVSLAASDPCVRRSDPESVNPNATRFLLDTIGELRAAYALADVVVVGRSFGSLYGSDPMEPAALAKPVVIGPAVSDFQATVDAMCEDDAIVQTAPQSLPETLRELLKDPARRRQLADNALACVERHRGASDVCAQAIIAALPESRP